MAPSDESPPTNDRSARNEGRVVRLDLIIATIALIASLSASIASVIQTKTLGDQFSASVWPYVVVNYDFNGYGRSVKAQIRNEGLGPALIRRVELTLDGKPQRTIDDIAALFAPDPRDRNVDNSDFGGGIVIRAADTLTFFAVHARSLKMNAGQRIADRVVTHVCYCSLLGNCWKTQTNATEPTPVAACGPPTPLIGLSPVGKRS